jgi:Putative adhesin
MKLLLCATALATCAAVTIPSRAAEATFERNLTFSGRADLTVSNGAGTVHITQGPAGQIHVSARVRSSWGDDSSVRDVAAHPPIEQTGNIVRIGAHRTRMERIAIDYEIQAPADAYLAVSNGSGDVTIEGVGANAKLQTGSGLIHVTGLRGGFSVETGSGNIYAEQIGNGDVKAETGSGSIELHSIKGALHAQTGSGNIKVGGKPAGPWKLETGSGSVEVWTGGAAFTLDAECGSGSIRSDVPIGGGSSTSKHHLAGKVNGGGPLVRIETGSGSIRIH